MLFTQVISSLKTFPLSKKDIEKGVKDKIRFTHPHLMSRVTAEVTKQNQSFLEGVWTTLSQEIQEPYNSKELEDFLIGYAIEYTVHKLEKS